MTAFPAAFNTWLIDLDPTVQPLPLVGWVHTGGLNVMPLVIGHPGPLVAGEAFLLRDDQVYDPATNILFGDEESWRDAITEDTPYRPGSPLPAFAAPAELKIVNSAPTTVTRTPSQPKDPAPAGQLVWGTKTYKSKSFWSFTPQDGEEFIFVVEGDNPVPKNATKITRDDFYTKRKAGAVERAGVPGDEPELPFEQPVEDDEDDDLI